jgi:DNA-binding MarR family transcriptional regulator
MKPHAKDDVPLLPEPCASSNGQMTIWISLARIQRRLHRLVERRLKRTGLPPLLWHDALQLLASQQQCELSAPDLQRELSLRQYQVSRLVERLVEGGLVTRRRLPVVGRTNVIRLTDRGLALQQRMAEAYAAVVETEIVGQYPGHEADMLLALLERFYQPSSAPRGVTITAKSQVVPARHASVALAEFVP